MLLLIQMMVHVNMLKQGCMDESACNYNADAEVDDASCTYPAEGLDCDGNCLSGVAVTAGGGSWISEIGWVISACDGTEILSGGGSCADVSGGYSVSMTDAYGDGWNGNILTVGDASYTIEVGAEASDWHLVLYLDVQMKQLITIMQMQM